jgi:hypothetical protein
MKDIDKLILLREILYDFKNMYTWQFEAKLNKNIERLEDETRSN